VYETDEQPHSDTPPPEPEGDRTGQAQIPNTSVVLSPEAKKGLPIGSGLAATLREGGREQVHSESFWRVVSLVVDEKEKERARLQADLNAMRVDRDEWSEKHHRLELRLTKLETRGESIGKLTTVQGLLYAVGGALVSPLVVVLLTPDVKTPSAMWFVALLGIAGLISSVLLKRLGPRGDE